MKLFRLSQLMVINSKSRFINACGLEIITSNDVCYFLDNVPFLQFIVMILDVEF